MTIEFFSVWKQTCGFGFAILQFVNEDDDSEDEFNRSLFGICKYEGAWYVDIFWKIF